MIFTYAILYRESLSGLIINDLGNYRYKRVLGLAGMFGDQLVSSEFLALVTLYRIWKSEVLHKLPFTLWCDIKGGCIVTLVKW